MSDALAVALLGGARLSHAGRDVVCPSRKSMALFAYLALSGRPQSRRELAALLWGRGDEMAARTSLRTALQRLPSAARPMLTADRERVAWTPQGRVEIDALRFQRLSQDDTVDSLAEAADLYRGELLQGLDADASPEFDDWLFGERARYRQLAFGVFDRLINRYRERALREAASGSAVRASALAAAQRWLQLEPAAEGAHRWLIQLYLDAGQVDAARDQFEACKRALAVATGRPPSAELRALADSIGGTSAPPAAASAAKVPEAVPGVPVTSFVGRIEDLVALDRLLADPACRLVTLHGLGGVGKTRLAHALMGQVAMRFAQGVSWVPLESIAGVADVPQAIAATIGVVLPARADPVQALAAALRAQQRLIVLDNVEHLLADGVNGQGLAEQVLAWLQAAPALRLLLTSREVLGLQEEWVYEVGGLSLAEALSSQPDTPPTPGASAAFDLFVTRARQAYLGFSPQAEWPHVLRLCRAVDGLPLALELMAAWVRTVPCADLARVLDSDAGLPARPLRNRAARHETLEAVVAYSWALLAPAQREALAALSVFAGGFTQAAAREVAGAELHLLSALVDKSMVVRYPDGRLGLHPVVRAFAERQHGLVRGARAQRLRRHTAYFTDALVRWRAGVDGPRELQADLEIGPEAANLTLAAEQWLSPANAGRVNGVAEPWMRYLFGRSAFRALLTWAERLLAARELQAATRVMVLTYRGRAQALLGLFDEGQTSFEEALALGRAQGLGQPLAFAGIYAVAIAYERDELDRARALIDEIEPLLETLGQPDLTMRARYVAAVIADAAGDLATSESLLAQSLALALDVGSPTFAATVRSQLATTQLRRGHVDAALQQLTEALALFERIGRRHDVARLNNTLAMAHLMQQRPSAAAEAARVAYRLFEEVGFTNGMAAASDSLGQAEQALGHTEAARAQYERAIALGGPILGSESRFHLGQLWLQAGRLDAAAQCVRQLCADAQRNRLAPLQHWALLLAADCMLATDPRSESAQAWLTALAADPNLDHDLRLRVGALQAHLPEAPGSAAPEPMGLVALVDDAAARFARDANDPA